MQAATTTKENARKLPVHVKVNAPEAKMMKTTKTSLVIASNLT